MANKPKRTIGEKFQVDLLWPAYMMIGGLGAMTVLPLICMAIGVTIDQFLLFLAAVIVGLFLYIAFSD